MSVFSDVLQAPPIVVFALSQECNEDPHPNKVNLTIGAYRNEEGKPWVLPVVRIVESQIAADETLNKEYLPITGLADFTQSAMALCIGEGSPLLTSKRADAVQALGGTGALKLACLFLFEKLGKKTLLVSDPTWPNHIAIAKASGMQVQKYRYWDANNKSLDFVGMMEDLAAAPDGAVVMLHAVAHNPTGVDPSQDQWLQILNVCRAKSLFPVLDSAYLGFASGDVDVDAASVRLFAESGQEFFLAQSFSKNFGLYNERVGNLVIVTKDPAVTGRVKSQMALLVRQIWSNPPNTGARLVSTVLRNSALLAEWKENIQSMAGRIKLMRKMMFEKLRNLGTPGNWMHIVQQIGMFSYTGLNPRQVEYLRSEYHLYAMPDGRFNMCALTSKNLDYVAGAIHDAVCNVAADPKL